MISARIDNFDAFNAQIKQLLKEFPREVSKEIYNTALVDVESFMKTKTNIPVDTGRLRASIHTKRIGKPNHQYTDREGNSYNGTITGQVSREQVIVGTNVEYAEYINDFGGGGQFSRRTVKGAKRPKGYGKEFFDKAVANGEKRLIERMEKLINDLGDSV
jgi:phage gpG-like protein